jgi:hypothetical protein
MKQMDRLWPFYLKREFGDLAVSWEMYGNRLYVGLELIVKNRMKGGHVEAK